MKKFLFDSLGVFIFFLFLFSVEISHAQTSGSNWVASGEPSKNFIENRSQFNGRDKLSDSKILYGIDQNGIQVYFTKQGLTYRFDERQKKDIREEEKEREKENKKMTAEEWAAHEKEERSIKINTDLVHLQWENANPNVQIVAENEATEYYSYCVGKENINHIKGYKKIIYKNLYPNIDVEYVFHPQDGIKYSLILHPGADASQVKMVYSNAKSVTTDKNNNIHLTTLFGDIIDHAPKTFYTDNTKSIIQSSFIKNGKTISFSLGNYNKTKTVVIDPWSQTPVLANSNGVWECESDGAGNVYIIGGDMPMKLWKYNAAGTFQWSYSTPWDTANNWLGTLATDLAGNSYITSGSIAEMQKISPTGGLIWNSPAPVSSSDEYWTLSFNCNQTKLIAGGTRLIGIPNIKGYGYAFSINLNNGGVIDTIRVASIFPVKVSSFSINYPNEIRAICSSPNGNYYFLTLDTIGAIKSSFAKLFSFHSGDTLNYKCENYRPNNGNSGIKSIKANKKFLYTQNGVFIQKRLLVNGSILASASIPGGISTIVSNTTPKMSQVGNSGIDIDSCGNVYVGSGNAVIKYDANLNFLTSVSLPFAVYDVVVNNNGEIIVAGSTGTSTSTSRTGYVQSINMSACPPMDTLCIIDSSTVFVPYYSPINSWNLILTNTPASNNLTGTLFTSENADVLLEIIDVQGRTIYKEKLAAQKGSNPFQINIGSLDKGIYFIKANNNKQNILSKFVKL